MDAMGVVDSEIDIDVKGGSYKEVVMVHLSRVIKLASCEYRGGFYLTVKTKDGGEREVYIEDTRESWGNSIYALGSILVPKFDDPMKKAWKEYEESLQRITKDFLDKSSLDDEVVLGEAYYEKMDDKVLLETFKIKKLHLVKKLFIALSELLGRLNYLEVGGGTF